MKKLGYLIIITILVACDPTVVFMEPQPEGKKDLGSFPSRYRGTYIEIDDSSVYIITAQNIFEKHDESFADPIEKMIEEEDVELFGDSLFIKDMNLKIPVTSRDDSIFGRFVFYDTIFDLSGDNKLRKLGRNYFLNMPTDSLWMVLKLTFDRSGKAYLCDIDHEKEMNIIGQYCEIETETDKEGEPKKYILAPDLKELRSLLKLETFTDTTEYLRISQEVLR